MYNISITTKVEDELDKVSKWYDTKIPGLSFRFYNSLDIAFHKLSKIPKSYSFYDTKLQIRKHKLPRFPYIIFYWIDNNIVNIIAVIHAHRSNRFVKRNLRK